MALHTGTLLDPRGSTVAHLTVACEADGRAERFDVSVRYAGDIALHVRDLQWIVRGECQGARVHGRAGSGGGARTASRGVACCAPSRTGRADASAAPRRPLRGRGLNTAPHCVLSFRCAQTRTRWTHGRPCGRRCCRSWIPSCATGGCATAGAPVAPPPTHHAKAPADGAGTPQPTRRASADPPLARRFIPVGRALLDSHTETPLVKLRFGPEPPPLSADADSDRRRGRRRGGAAPAPRPQSDQTGLRSLAGHRQRVVSAEEGLQLVVDRTALPVVRVRTFALFRTHRSPPSFPTASRGTLIGSQSCECALMCRTRPLLPQPTHSLRPPPHPRRSPEPPLSHAQQTPKNETRQAGSALQVLSELVNCDIQELWPPSGPGCDARHPVWARMRDAVSGLRVRWTVPSKADGTPSRMQKARGAVALPLDARSCSPPVPVRGRLLLCFGPHTSPTFRAESEPRRPHEGLSSDCAREAHRDTNERSLACLSLSQTPGAAKSPNLSIPADSSNRSSLPPLFVPSSTARQESFPLEREGGRRVTVAEYYRQRGVPLRHPQLPCLVMRGANQCWVPLELCEILPNQVVVRATAFYGPLRIRECSHLGASIENEGSSSAQTTFLL